VTGEIHIPIHSDSDIVTARQKGRAMATETGFSGSDSTMIATAISEVARNIVTYAQKGEVILSVANLDNKYCLIVEARDEGPGIANIQLALQDGYSTSGSLGLGLPGARRLMDEFEIQSEIGRGTTIVMKKWKH
jgi:serine/threonine-protein kinase RsbT